MGCGLALMAFGVLAVFGWSGRLHGGNLAVAGDAHYSYLAGRSLAWDGDIDLTNQLRALGDRWGLGRDPAADGTRLPVRELGPALLMVPGLWLHDLLDAARDHAPRYAALLGSIALGLCVLILGPTLRRALPHAPAAARVLGSLTPLAFVVPFYSLAHVGYPHAPDAVCCTLIVAALVGDRSPRVVGLAIALGALFRLQNYLWIVWPVTAALHAAWHARGDADGASPAPLASHGSWRRVGIIAAWSTLGLTPQLYAAIAHPGSTRGTIRWGIDFFDLDHLAADVWAVLGGVHGLFSVTPIALVGAVGIALALATHRASPSRSPSMIERRHAIAASVVSCCFLLLMATARDPDGGHAFGARRLAGMTPLIALGVTHTCTFAARRGRAWLAAAALLVIALSTQNALQTAACAVQPGLLAP